MLAFDQNHHKKGVNHVIPTLPSMPEQYPCTNRSLLVLYELRICYYFTGPSRPQGISQNQRPPARPPHPKDPLILYLTKVGFLIEGEDIVTTEPRRTLAHIRNEPIPRHNPFHLLAISQTFLWNNIGYTSQRFGLILGPNRVNLKRDVRQCRQSFISNPDNQGIRHFRNPLPCI